MKSFGRRALLIAAVVLTAALLFSGALCGFLFSRSSLAKIIAQTTGYCDYIVSAQVQVPAGLKNLVVFQIPGDPGNYYLCIPCPTNGGSCTEGYADAFLEQQFNWAVPYMGLTNYGVCGPCIWPS